MLMALAAFIAPVTMADHGKVDSDATRITITGQVLFITARLNGSSLEVRGQQTGTLMFTATEPSTAINNRGVFSAREDQWSMAEFAMVATKGHSATASFVDLPFPVANLDGFATARPALAASPSSGTLYMFDVVSR